MGRTRDEAGKRPRHRPGTVACRATASRPGSAVLGSHLFVADRSTATEFGGLEPVRVRRAPARQAVLVPTSHFAPSLLRGTAMRSGAPKAARSHAMMRAMVSQTDPVGPGDLTDGFVLRGGSPPSAVRSRPSGRCSRSRPPSLVAAIAPWTAFTRRTRSCPRWNPRVRSLLRSQRPPDRRHLRFPVTVGSLATERRRVTR